MTETLTVEQYLSNIMENKSLLEEMAKDPNVFQQVLDKANEISGGRIPGGPYVRLAEKVSETILVSSEAAAAFTDEEMLLLYTDYYHKWFLVPGFNVAGAGFENPIFSAIQSAFTASAKHNHSKCFAYLMQNVAIEDYDIDGLTLFVALQERHRIILGLIGCFANAEKFGMEGALGGLIHPRTIALFRNSTWMGNALREDFSRFKMLGH